MLEDDRDDCKENAEGGGQLSHKQRTLIKNQPLWFGWIGIDLHEWWGVPFMQKIRKGEEAWLGVTAWNRESERLQQIGLLFRELKRIAEVLDASVMQWNAEFDDDDFYNNDSGQERLQVWFRQNVYQNLQLGKLWTKLLTSANEEAEEEGLLIEFTTEWCGR